MPAANPEPRDLLDKDRPAQPAWVRFLFVFIATFLLVPAPGTPAATDDASLVAAQQGRNGSTIDSSTAVEAYTNRVAALQRRAMRTGLITYADVIEACYGRGTITRSVLRSKERLHGTAPGGFRVTADYAQRHKLVAVHSLSPVRNPDLRSTLVAQYDAIAHTIGLSDAASPFAILHEAGHSLQRSTLRARGSRAERRKDESPDDLARFIRGSEVEGTTLHRLRYLASQEEFEVRLQDLNRFYAIAVAGRPIRTPQDSLHALMALGMPLEPREARAAFALGNADLAEAELAACRLTPDLPAESLDNVFEDARELLLVRQLALQVDRACWNHLLARMIFEAPAHL